MLDRSTLTQLKALYRPSIFNLLLGAILYAVTTTLYLAGTPSLIAISAMSITTVILIVFGETLENSLVGSPPPLDETWLVRMAHAIASREAILPTFLIVGLWTFGFVQSATIAHAILGKADIVFLILTFALVSHGIRHSGYFRYAAFRVLEVCDGSMTRMTLYLFLLSSILTYVTSNDIVILVMTPIVLTLCHQAHIANARLLLLGQFVAANTLSMGLLIGSPTNVIVSADLGMNFFDYFRLMLVPSFLAVVISFLVLHGINALTPLRLRRALKWEYESKYVMPALKQQPGFTHQMRYWIGGFGMLVVGVAIVSYIPNLPFITVTGPAFFVALYSLYRLGQVDGTKQAAYSDAPTQQAGLWLRSLGDLPYQIVFFAAAFFIVAEEVSLLLDSGTIVAAFENQNPWLASALPMLGTGLLVNLINDLPAAALIGEVLSAVPGTAQNTILLQSVLVGLNIACYVTPIGALAGIIWFHIMRTGARPGMSLPTRPGMVLYGAIHFFFTTMALSVLIPFSSFLADWLASPVHSVGEHPVLFAVGFPVLALSLMLLLSILRKERVFLGDVRAFLTAASWLNVRSKRMGVGYQLVIVALVIALFGTSIWILEGNPVDSGKMGSVGEYVVWVLVFLGSANDGGWFPETRLAKVLAGLMPIAAIFLIVRTIQATRDQTSLEKVSKRIACGEVFTRRIVILDYHPNMRPFVRFIWQGVDESFFQTILYTHHKPPQQWEEDRDFDAIYTYQCVLDSVYDFQIVVDDYRLERADEIYLLGEKFIGEHGRDRVLAVLRRVDHNLEEGAAEQEWIALGGAGSSGAREGRKSDVETVGDDARVAGRRHRLILGGEGDPEDRAGRLPRIFLWDDVRLEDTVGLEAVERLVVRLPQGWRAQAGEAGAQEVLSTKLIEAVGRTASERSWVKRRRAIDQYIGA